MLFQLSRLGLVAGPQGKQVCLPQSFRMPPALPPGVVIDWGGGGGAFSILPCHAPAQLLPLALEPGMSKIPRTWLPSLLWTSSQPSMSNTAARDEGSPVCRGCCRCHDTPRWPGRPPLTSTPDRSESHPSQHSASWLDCCPTSALKEHDAHVQPRPLGTAPCFPVPALSLGALGAGPRLFGSSASEAPSLQPG